MDMDNSLIDGNNSRSSSLKLEFKYLSSFAEFILNNELDEYVNLQLTYSMQENVPILKFLSHLTEDELFDLAKKSAIELLQSLIENTADQYIELNRKNYEENIIPYFENESVLSEDITSISLVRRKSFRKLLALYSNESEMHHNIMDELDQFLAASETASYNTMLNIHQEKIQKINQKLANKHDEILEAQKLADMGSYVWNITEDTSEFTQGVLDILEMEESSVSFENFLANVHEDDRSQLKAALEKSMKGGLFNYEFRYLINNKMKYLWSRGFFKFSEGKAISLKGTIMDISHKRRMLEKLQKSEELNQLAQALTHIGNWTWEIDTNLIHWSDEMYRIYGMEPQSEQISFSKFLSFIHEEDREKRKAEIERSLKSLIAEDYFMRIVDAKGATKVLRGKGEVIVDKKNIPIRIVGTCQDITKEYELNIKIQQKEEYLDQLILNAPDSIVVKNEDGKINLWNPKAEKMFGWKVDEVMGKNFSKTFVPSKEQNAYQKNVSQLLRQSPSKLMNKTLELSMLHKNGTIIHTSLTFSRLVQENTSLFIIFIRNISEEKKNKEELQAKKLELEKINATLQSKNFLLKAANKELESFNYIASHDLQEPLRKIQTFANRIVEDEKYKMPANVSNYVDKILYSSSKMKSLIRDLLKFSQSTQHNNSFQSIELNQILEEVLDSISNNIETKEAKIQSEILPIVKAVPFQMHQLFLNILGNAIKYSKKNIAPIININYCMVKGSSLSFPLATKSAEYHHIIVEDNGVGFERKDADKIFDLFHRLHDKKYSGNGVGLAICKKIVNNHKGFITAESSMNKGAIFNIYLPKSID